MIKDLNDGNGIDYLGRKIFEVKSIARELEAPTQLFDNNAPYPNRSIKYFP